jgi:hypothetical protein
MMTVRGFIEVAKHREGDTRNGPAGAKQQLATTTRLEAGRRPPATSGM